MVTTPTSLRQADASTPTVVRVARRVTAIPPMTWVTRAIWGDEWESGPRSDVAARQLAAAGVVGLMAIVMALGFIRAIGSDLFTAQDETSHVAYALALMQGHIPFIDEFPADLPIPGMRPGLSIWVANHPPLTYVILGIPLRLGIAAGAPLAGFWAARLLNSLALALALIPAARVVALMFPRRPRLLVIVATVFALPPYLQHIASTAYTDGLALLPAVMLIAVAVKVLLHGPTTHDLRWILGLSAVCALCRSQSLVVVFAAGLALAIAHLLHRQGRRGDPQAFAGVLGPGVIRAFGRGVVAAACVGGAALLSSGWFYLLNIRRYGSPSATEALFELHNRSPRETLWTHLTRIGDVRLQTNNHIASVEGIVGETRPFAVPDHYIHWFRWSASLAVITAVVLLAVHIARRRGGIDVTRVAAWSMLLALPVTFYVLMQAFTSAGGSPHQRYIWPGWIGAALVLGVGLDAWTLPVGRLAATVSRRLTLPAGGLFSLFGYLLCHTTGWPNVLVWQDLAEPGQGFYSSVSASFAARLLPIPGLLTGALCTVLVAGTAMVAFAMLRCGVSAPCLHSDERRGRRDEPSALSVS